MNNSFTFKRFSSLVSASYSSSVRSNLRKVAAFAAVIASVYLFGRVVGGQVNESAVVGFSIMVASIAWFVNISWGFRAYFKERTASFQLMLPAARSEKFILALINNVIIIPVVLVAVIYLNNVLWTSLFTTVEPLVLFKQIPQELGIWSRLSSVFSILSFVALFFWGSIMFRRHQLIYTLLVLFSLSLIISGIVINILKTDSSRVLLIAHNMERTAMIGDIISFAVVIGMFIWSWTRFKKLQITK